MSVLLFAIGWTLLGIALAGALLYGIGKLDG